METVTASEQTELRALAKPPDTIVSAQEIELVPDDIVSDDLVLAKIDAARLAIAEANTLQEANAIVAMADAAKVYAERTKASAAVQKYAAEIGIRAERRLGEILAAAKEAGQITHSVRGDVVDGGDNIVRLQDAGISRDVSSRAQKLAAIPSEKFEKAIKEAGEELSKSRILKKTSAHVSQNSGEAEWYTPKIYIDAAHEVMGGIDLDPASSVAANDVVKADQFYTEEDDGLTKEWSGRVWLNPPYGQPLMTQFCDKLVESFDDGFVEQAIVLTNNATETKWFHRLASAASAICFPLGRISFWYPERESFTPLQGQAFFYFGKSVHAFRETFQQFGIVLLTQENSGNDAGCAETLLTNQTMTEHANIRTGPEWGG
jgi:ParB family chromosome partitioning protein